MADVEETVNSGQGSGVSEETGNAEAAENTDSGTTTASAEAAATAPVQGGEPETEEVAVAAADDTGATAAEDDTTAESQVPVSFSVDEDTPAILERAAPILEKYELPADVQAVIDVLKAKAEVPALQEYADYGDADAIKDRLERQSHLDSWRQEDNQGYRLNSDKFVSGLTPDQIDWLRYDLNRTPSTKYAGLTIFDEGIVDAVANESDTPQTALAKFAEFTAAIKSGVLPESDVPAFIPQNLREAYAQLPRPDRDALAALDPAYEEDGVKIGQQLSILRLMQDGIDGKQLREQQKVQYQQTRQQEFTLEVAETEIKYFDAFRESFAKQVGETVKFSDDAKVQALQTYQIVTLLSTALDDGSAGKFAREALVAAGIDFDGGRGEQLVKDIEKSVIDLTVANRAVDQEGRNLDPISLNKAKRAFENTGKQLQIFAKGVLDQLVRFNQTGKAEAVKAEIAKQKIALKARSVPKGTPSAQKQKEAVPQYGTKEWRTYWADREIAEQQRRAAVYQ